MKRSFKTFEIESKEDCDKRVLWCKSKVPSLINSKNFIASGSRENKIIIFEVYTGECVKTFDCNSRVRCLALVPNKPELVAGLGDGSIKHYNLKTSDCLRRIKGHSWYITCLLILKNELISSSGDCLIKCWNLSTGECLRVFSSHTSCVNSLVLIPNSLNQFLSSSYDKSIKIFDLEQSKSLNTFIGHLDAVLCLCSISNRLIASGSVDKMIKVKK